MGISEDDYKRHLDASEEMSVAELGRYVRDTLGIAPPDEEPGWFVRVDYVDTPNGPAERFTWQRTIQHVVNPEEVSAEKPPAAPGRAPGR